MITWLFIMTTWLTDSIEHISLNIESNMKTFLATKNRRYVYYRHSRFHFISYLFLLLLSLLSF
jgi:hypothetical protein